MKKAQGLSLNTMVIAAIVLVVLIVSIAVFTGFVNTKAIPFLKVQSECETQVNKGKCIDMGKEATDCVGGTAYDGLGCGDKKICCVGAKK